MIRRDVSRSAAESVGESVPTMRHHDVGEIDFFQMDNGWCRSALAASGDMNRASLASPSMSLVESQRFSATSSLRSRDWRASRGPSLTVA